MMAKQTIQVADKPTLDEVKALLENSGYGLEAIKKALGDSGGDFYKNDGLKEYKYIGFSMSKDSRVTDTSTYIADLPIGCTVKASKKGRILSARYCARNSSSGYSQLNLYKNNNLIAGFGTRSDVSRMMLNYKYRDSIEEGDYPAFKRFNTYNSVLYDYKMNPDIGIFNGNLYSLRSGQGSYLMNADVCEFEAGDVITLRQGKKTDEWQTCELVIGYY